MTQSLLPYQYQAQDKNSGMTALSGLPLFLDLFRASGLFESISRHLCVRSSSQGFTDTQMVTSLLLLQLAGGECIDDLRILEADEGFSRLLHGVEHHGLPRRVRRELERRWRKVRTRTVPSPSSVFRYLSAFHDPAQEALRVAGKAFIPAPNGALRGFAGVMRDLASFVFRRGGHKTSTLDMDATLVETLKENALFCYEKFKAYQPMNTYWAEAGLMLHTEFRDGNVPAGHEQLRVLKEALLLLPEGVEKVYLRSDTAGYQWDLLSYCAGGENERFGRIEFAVGADVTAAFKKAVSEIPEAEWHPLLRERNGIREETDQEYAEVCFVPNEVAKAGKRGPSYRFLAIRERFSVQLGLPDLPAQRPLPFQTMEMGGCPYKLFGIVTNRDLPGEELIRWYRGRCGKSEEAHAILKEDLAGGKLPSGDFGENAAWWWITVLSFNLQQMLKRLVLGGEWVSKRMKAIRFALIHLPGRVAKHAGSLWVQVNRAHPSLSLLIRARSTIAEMALPPIA